MDFAVKRGLGGRHFLDEKMDCAVGEVARGFQMKFCRKNGPSGRHFLLSEEMDCASEEVAWGGFK